METTPSKGGFLAGAAGGTVGSAVMMPVQNVGNHLYFGDPLMSVQDYAIGIGIGTLTGGAVNGSLAAIKGNNFWTGNQVAAGRGVFSVNNTPIRTAPEMNPIPGKPITGVDAPAAKNPNQIRMEQVRNVGKIAEDMVRTDKPIFMIESLTNTARRRYPDILTTTTIGEVKNVSHLNLTNQLKDFHLYSQRENLQMILYTRPSTTFSAPLQNLINKGEITVFKINF